MSFLPSPRLVRSALITLALVALIALGSSSVKLVFAAGNNYLVNSTADTPDADLGVPACADASGKCTLRASIMQANYTSGADTITLPAGLYKLTRVGDDDNAVLGDLDITDDLTLQGAGSGVTSIDGNGAVTNDRVIDILAPAKEINIGGLKIANGKKNSGHFDEGGGLYWGGGGGHLNLHDLIVENNTASYGGGLFLGYGPHGDTVDLENLIVRSNTATYAVGGLGVSFSASFTGFILNHSSLYSNTAYEAGGLYLDGTDLPSNFYSAVVENTEIYSNNASLDAGLENRGGSTNVPMVLQNTYFHNNKASILGGGIGNFAVLVVNDTTLESNSSAMNGGGFYNWRGGNARLTNATLSGNSAVTKGGGIDTEPQSSISILNVSLGGNTAATGGGWFWEGGTYSTLTPLSPKAPAARLQPGFRGQL